MNSIVLLIAGFILCSALITYSGTRLSKYGDIIAELTGMGKAWMGLILMAAVTSLPELFTGFSAIVLIDSPDIAVGSIMGSLSFNLVILAVLDYFVPGKPLSSVVTKSHVLAGFFGMILIVLSIIGILYGDLMPDIGWFSTFPVLLIILYLLTIRIIYENDRKFSTDTIQGVNTEYRDRYKDINLKIAIKRYVYYALLVIAGAILLPYFADELATRTGMSESFVGTLLVAATTSLPELVISIAAVRMGSMDMAVGNLLGSNIFNMLILAINDLLYTKGKLLLVSDPNHALSGLVTLLMTAVVGVSILIGSPKKRFVLGIDAIILIILYITLILSLYHLG
ncbi:cation:H+ antiporter [Daejeonella rubra]|uniref:Cation:H+ antiporter n=1 Tax=Daejeonella rubra TaxID=990371 RepID=A0A1G9V6M6_9SPHI|nr:sodium:calcium antiporter [Daejeonella rubra]SDM67838.1 cation:H+ antiporter [Daejeonella rubra]